MGPGDAGSVPRETVPLVFGYQTQKVLGQQLLLGIQRDFCGIAGGKSPILGTRSLSPIESEQQEGSGTQGSDSKFASQVHIFVQLQTQNHSNKNFCFLSL